jgi:transmembrane sensor
VSRDEEAARWFAVLRRGLMTLEERSAYEQWRRRRENRDALAAMGELWQSLEGAVLPSRPRIALKLAFAAICVLTLGTGIMSSAEDASFWTGLDWTNR